MVRITQGEKVEPVELVIEEEHEIKTSAGKFVVQRGSICLPGYENNAEIGYYECINIKRVLGPGGFGYTQLDLEKEKDVRKPRLPELLKGFDLSETEIREIYEAFSGKRAKNNTSR